jgi:DNA-binding response OmpR family regulator
MHGSSVRHRLPKLLQVFRSIDPGPRTAFVVDDDEVGARAIARALSNEGFRVLGLAHDADTAVTQIPACSPGLLVIDVELRGGPSGVDVALAIAASTDAPVVFLTGADDPDLTKLATIDGTFGFAWITTN